MISIFSLDCQPSYTKDIISFSRGQFSEQNLLGNHFGNMTCDANSLFWDKLFKASVVQKGKNQKTIPEKCPDRDLFSLSVFSLTHYGALCRLLLKSKSLPWTPWLLTGLQLHSTTTPRTLKARHKPQICATCWNTSKEQVCGF